MSAAGIVLVLLFGLMLLLEVPIAVSLGLSSVVVLVAFDLRELTVVPSNFLGTIGKFNLLTIPYFIVAGLVLGRSGISKRLVDFASAIVGDVPGGLAIVGVVVCIFFAGISGSGPADVAALGLILIPAMVEAGYSRGFAAALMASGGGIGIIVPPSIALVVYGIAAASVVDVNVDIGRLFLAGVGPGILVGLSLIVFIYCVSVRRGYRGSRTRGSLKEIAAAFGRAFWGLLAPLIILGGIYGGKFTPTEAAAVAVVYAVFVDVVIYREMKLCDIFGVFVEAGVTSAQVLFIVACAYLFSWVLQYEGVVSSLSHWLISHASNRYVFLAIANGVLLAAGCMIDAISIFYIFLPILLPAVLHFGIDPVHFGIIMTVNLAIGQITPPVGVNLFVASSVSGEPLNRLYRAILPFIAAEAFALLLVTFVPPISLALPRWVDWLKSTPG